ncbi:hypothetical protein [Solibaculum intestinale]|uniref:Uncharacterized protein n=1 Tax=Solibaculum intestinale TaxID=3133165 RepID=A0ABV1E306_9FIRM
MTASAARAGEIMANEQNLIPLNKRGKEEAKKIRQMGQAAQKERQRAKKTMREYAELLLSLPLNDVRKKNKLAKMGVPAEDIDNKLAVVAALMLEAQAGYVPAAKELRSIIGEDSQQNNDALERLDEVLEQLNEVMQHGD